MSILSVVPTLQLVELTLAFVLCAVACGLILTGRQTVQRGAATQTWPAVEGVVIDSAIAADREDGLQRFRPVVRYRYEVDGQRYEGSRIRFAGNDGFRKFTRARRLLDRYRAGMAIKVHYDPTRPGTAVLQTGVSNAALMRPMYVVASTIAVYTLFTIGIAIAG